MGSRYLAVGHVPLAHAARPAPILAHVLARNLPRDRPWPTKLQLTRGCGQHPAFGLVAARGSVARAGFGGGLAAARDRGVRQWSAYGLGSGGGSGCRGSGCD